MNRRNFLGGMAGILASGFAPAVGHAGILMPVKKIVRAKDHLPRWTRINDGWEQIQGGYLIGPQFAQFLPTQDAMYLAYQDAARTGTGVIALSTDVSANGSLANLRWVSREELQGMVRP